MQHEESIHLSESYVSIVKNRPIWNDEGKTAQVQLPINRPSTVMTSSVVHDPPSGSSTDRFEWKPGAFPFIQMLHHLDHLSFHFASSLPFLRRVVTFVRLC